MKPIETKLVDDLRLPADEFDRLMRSALGAAQPVEGEVKPPARRQTRKTADRPAKK